MDIKRKALFCKDCMFPDTHGFKKVVALKNSGLLIYVHKGEDTKKNAVDKSKLLDVFILHNNSEHDLRREDYAIEMCQLRTRCFRCINIVKRVRSLLDELNFIKKNQVIGLCEHCKRNPGACKRCQYIVNKFLDSKPELHKEKQEQFKSWFSQLNQFLHYVLNDENLDRAEINNDPSALELERLLEELKHALELRNLHTTFFPTNLAQLSSMTAGNEMIDDLLAKINVEDLRKLAFDENLPPIGEGMHLLPKQYPNDSHLRLPPLTRAIQKKSTNEWIEKDSVIKNQEFQKGTKKEKYTSISDMTSKGSTSKLLEKMNNLKNQPEGKSGNVSGTHRSRENNKVVSEITSRTTISKPIEKNKVTKNQSKDKPGNVNETNRKSKIHKEKNKATSETYMEFAETHRNKNEHSKHTSRNKKFIFTDKSQDNVVQVTFNNKGKNPVKGQQNTTSMFANMELPFERTLMAGDDEFINSDDSASFVECGQQGPDLITEMINKTKVVDYDPHYKDNMIMLSHSEENNLLPDSSVGKQQMKKKTVLPDGILHYRLSDKTFISKGYTILPVIKVMKRIFFYKMTPANPHFNWFERHKHVGTKNYDTGEILAEINKNGTGKWFYKNGCIALDYYNAKDVTSGQRYVLYSSGEESNTYQRDKERAKYKPQVIGVFDLLGNGVVYDLNGNERIKFNQSEGVVIDSKIAPVSRWKWNSLNDPPQFESILVDNYESSFTAKEEIRNRNSEILRTELQNFAKQKAHKLQQKFKPFQIRMKAFKINDEFSLRIIDQANIYLLFRHGTVSLKLNLGLHLVSNEIVDIDEAEIGGMAVATPYDVIPAKTASIANIQQNLQIKRDLQSQVHGKHSTFTLDKVNVSSKYSI